MENFLDVPAVLVKQDKLIEVEAGWTSRASPHEQFAFGVTGHFRDFGSCGQRFVSLPQQFLNLIPGISSRQWRTCSSVGHLRKKSTSGG